jgi:Fur family peroxide stress response transcriptional regulator
VPNTGRSPDASAPAHRVRGRLRELEQICNDRGFRVTIQRRTVFEKLVARTDHPTADQVHEDVRARLPSVSRMTVYRILEWVVRLGLARKVCHPGSAVRFDPNTGPHHHLVCLSCSRLLDFVEPALDELPVPAAAGHAGFEVSGHFVQYRGVCSECRRKERRPGRARPVSRRSRAK